MTYEQMDLFAGEHHAKAIQLPDSERDWMTLVATSRLPFSGFFPAINPDLSYGKMCPEFYRTKPARLTASSTGYRKSGMGFRGQCWTLNTLASRSGASVSLLSDILETGALPPRYYLTKRACVGILRRAEKRGKALPVALHQALQAVAGVSSEQAKAEGETL
jgi:hypothetical protein